MSYKENNNSHWGSLTHHLTLILINKSIIKIFVDYLNKNTTIITYKRIIFIDYLNF